MKKRFYALLAAMAILISILSSCGVVRMSLKSVALIKAVGNSDASDIIKDAMFEAGFGAELIFPKGEYRIEKSVAFRKDVSVVIEEGAVFNIAKSGSVTFNTCSVDAGGYQIFKGDGDVVFDPLMTEIRAEWFGAVPNDGADDSEAILKAFSKSNRVVFGEGRFTVSKPINLKDAYKTAVNEVIFVGAGKDKTVFEVAPNITAIDSCTDTESTFLDIYDIGFTEKGGGKTSCAVKVKGPFSKIHGCDFSGFDVGVFHTNAYCCYMTGNTAENCGTAFEISELSLYLYFDSCEADSCGTFIKCEVPPSGGISNAILVTDCKSTNAYGRDISITYNQAVWLTNCEFTGGTGGDAAVWFYGCADSDVGNCVISSANAERNGIIYQTTNYCSVTDSVIENNRIGVDLQGCNYSSITGNYFADNSEADLQSAIANGLTVKENEFTSNVNFKSGDRNKHTTVYENTFSNAEYDFSQSKETIISENNSFGVSDIIRPEAGAKSTSLDVLPRVFDAVDLIDGTEPYVFSVTDYGADSDGKTDCTAAVLEAMEKASESSGVLFFPSGNYLIGDVTVPENVTVAVNGLITVKDGATLDIRSKSVKFPKKQIFELTGNVLLSGIDYCYPEWFGATPKRETDSTDALRMAINAASHIYLSQGYYGIYSTVVIPQNKNIVISGMGQNATFIGLDNINKDFKAFEYDYQSGSASTVAFEFLYVNASPRRNAALISYNGAEDHREGNVKIRGILCNTVRNLVEAKFVTGCFFEEIRSDDAASLFELTSADDVTFSKVIASDNTVGMVRAYGKNPDGRPSHGLRFLITSSVGAGGTDFIIKDYQDVFFDHSSGDLGYGSDVEAALLMENVGDFKLVRCWWASNAGLSVIESSPYAEVKAGIWLINCGNGRITNNSVVNQRDGIRITGFKEDETEGITIDGNTFLGNGRSEIWLESTKNVSIEGNFFVSTTDYNFLNEKYRAKDHNLNLLLTGEYENVYIKYNFGRIYLESDGFNEQKADGITYRENYYK